MKSTNTFLIHYTMVDEFADYLISKGRKIVCIAYGYANQFDLIVWED